MDDDDVFRPNAFKVINKFLQKYAVGESYPVYNFLRSNAKVRYNEYFRVYSFSEMISDAIVGDLVHVINKKSFLKENQYFYPNSRVGAESLLWYKIAINHGFPVINEVVVELLEDAEDRLTNISRQVKYAKDFANYQIEILKTYKKEILKTNNKKFLVKKYMGAITYLLLSGENKRAMQYWLELLKYSKMHVFIFPLLILPKSVIRKLFYIYRRKKK